MSEEKQSLLQRQSVTSRSDKHGLPKYDSIAGALTSDDVYKGHSWHVSYFPSVERSGSSEEHDKSVNDDVTVYTNSTGCCSSLLVKVFPSGFKKESRAMFKITWPIVSAKNT